MSSEAAILIGFCIAMIINPTGAIILLILFLLYMFLSK